MQHSASTISASFWVGTHLSKYLPFSILSRPISKAVLQALCGICNFIWYELNFSHPFDSPLLVVVLLGSATLPLSENFLCLTDAFKYPGKTGESRLEKFLIIIYFKSLT